MAILTQQGLVIRRFPQILQQYEDYLRANVSPSIKLDSNTVIGQLFIMLATQEAKYEELLELLNDSKDPDKAEGAQLDALFYNLGLTRNTATKTSGFTEFYVVGGSTVNKETVLENRITSKRFLTTEQKTADTTSCYSYDLGFNEDYTENNTITFSVAGEIISYTLTNADSIAQNRQDLINTLAVYFNDNTTTVGITASSYVFEGECYLRISSDSLFDFSIGLTPDSTSELTLKNATLRVRTEAVEDGELTAAANTLTELISPVSGVLSVSNSVSFSRGSDRESDEDFRERKNRVLSGSGMNTYTAMLADITEIPEVSEVVLLENSENITDPITGLPPHSFEVLVTAPEEEYLDAEIAEAIFNNMPLGITNFSFYSGNAAPDPLPSFGVVTDVIGANNTIVFTRPSTINIKVYVEYKVYEEEGLTPNIDIVLQGIAEEYLSSLRAGEDFIPSRLLKSIYTSTEGLGEIEVLATLNGSGDAPNSNRIFIPIRERAALSDFLAVDVTQ